MRRYNNDLTRACLTTHTYTLSIMNTLVLVGQLSALVALLL